MLNSRLFLKILTFLIPAIWDEKGIVSASSIQAQLALHIHPELLTASLLEGNAVKILARINGIVPSMQRTIESPSCWHLESDRQACK